jgi:CRISPR system Cascade subunit CasE
MNWLARLNVDAETTRAERIFDSYAWHRRIWECFPGMPEAERTFLTRVDPLEGAFRVWVLAAVKPVRPEWCHEGSFALKEISPSFLSHLYYAFDLRANPVKAQVQRDEKGQPLLKESGKRKRGKRVPFRAKLSLAYLAG